MNININIDGVLRNTIERIVFYYEMELLPDSVFEYGINHDNKCYNVGEIENLLKFQSTDEKENFIYLDYSLEIFGHSNVSYKHVFMDLNNFIHKNKKHNITLIGMDEMGKSKPSTLFFLSKNGCLTNSIKFIKSNDIEKEWKKCHLWITGDKKILDTKPNKKNIILFETKYGFNENTINTLENLKL